jgi:DNA-binding response OmpR family regulator
MPLNGATHRGDELDGRRILLVEDEYFIADDLKRALCGRGVRVVGPVPDLAAGLELARHEELDAAILDVNLGGEMSYPIADELGERGVPFLFTSGYDDATLNRAYCRVTLIEKPFDVEAVMAALIELVCGAAIRGAPS